MKFFCCLGFFLLVPSSADAGRFLSSPLDAATISCDFCGYRNSNGDCHGGIDLHARIPVTVIVAADGIVVQTLDGLGNLYHDNPKGVRAYGNHVRIRHPNGYMTIYAHLQSGSLTVGMGDDVRAGQQLGITNNSGWSSGPHLHFEVRDPSGKRVDPYDRPIEETRGCLSTAPVNPRCGANSLWIACPSNNASSPDAGMPSGACRADQPCNTGLMGECAKGATACVDGGTICRQVIHPTDETCNGLDDNCNGQVDELWNTGRSTDIGRPCSVGFGPCERRGIWACAAGGRSTICLARPGTPEPEVCDGIDNDCDGIVDNHMTPKFIIGNARLSAMSIASNGVRDALFYVGVSSNYTACTRTIYGSFLGEYGALTTPPVLQYIYGDQILGASPAFFDPIARRFRMTYRAQIAYSRYCDGAERGSTTSDMLSVAEDLTNARVGGVSATYFSLADSAPGGSHGGIVFENLVHNTGVNVCAPSGLPCRTVNFGGVTSLVTRYHIAVMDDNRFCMFAPSARVMSCYAFASQASSMMTLNEAVFASAPMVALNSNGIFALGYSLDTPWKLVAIFAGYDGTILRRSVLIQDSMLLSLVQTVISDAQGFIVTLAQDYMGGDDAYVFVATFDQHGMLIRITDPVTVPIRAVSPDCISGYVSGPVLVRRRADSWFELFWEHRRTNECGWFPGVAFACVR